MNEQTKIQLTILEELGAIARQLNIECWIAGGWAIDFLLGKITRSHDDIDLVLWIKDRERFEEALLEADYVQEQIKKEFHDRQSDFMKNNSDVQIGYITKSNDGKVMMNGLPEWIWRKDSLQSETYDLLGMTMKVIHPRQLLEEKQVYEEIGRPYRAKDAISKKLLGKILLDNN